MSYYYQNNRRWSNNWLDQPSGYSDINLGFGVYHQKQRERPKVQLLTRREPPIEQQRKLCTKCHGNLNWLDKQRRFICYSCGVTYSEHYDTLPSSNDSSIRPLQSVDPYEKINPAFISIKPNRRLQGEVNDSAELQITGSYRKANIKTNDLAAVTEARIKQYFQDEVYVK